MLKFRISFSPIVTKFIKQNNKEIESKYKEETKNNTEKLELNMETLTEKL